LDASGFSKGYGFIRFGNESEQQSALHSMTGTPGLGSKPIKVNKVSITAKNKLMESMGLGSGGGGMHHSMMSGAAAGSTDPSATDYSQYWQNQYGQYWSQYAAWSQYSQQYYDPSQANAYYAQRPDQASAAQPSYPSQPGDVNGGVELDPQLKSGLGKSSDSSSKMDSAFGVEFFDSGEQSIFEGDDMELVDHSAKLDPAILNQKYFARTEELWNSLEASRWWKDD